MASKEPEILVKAKSEVSLACTTSQSLSVELSTATLGGGSNTASTAQVHTSKQQQQPLLEQPPTASKTSKVIDDSMTSEPASIVAASGAAAKRKSQSLDQLSSQAMWRSDAEEVALNKGKC